MIRLSFGENATLIYKLSVLVFCVIAVVSHQPAVVLTAFLCLLFVGIFCTNCLVFSGFFFAAFFKPLVFLLPELFSLKHFHLSLLMLAAVVLVKGEFWGIWRRGVDKNKIFSYWLLIILISIMSGIGQGHHMEVIKTAGNLTLIVIFIIFLSGTVGAFSFMRQSIVYFLLGVLVRVSLASFSSLGTTLYSEDLLYNNHVGFLTASALFLSLPFLTASVHKWIKSVFWLLNVCLFLAVLGSCSRTAYVSFFMSFCIFCLLLFRMSKQNMMWRVQVRGFLMKLVAVYFLAFAVALLALWPVSERLRLIALMFYDPNYWQHALQDKQNFGFLGIYRLEQFYLLRDIMKINPLFGVGFSHAVRDMHSLYIALLGGTGIAGALVFVGFVCRWVKKVLRWGPSIQMNSFRISVFCSFLVWLLFSFMENFMVQFNVWIVLALGLIMVSSDLEENTENYDKEK